MSSSATPKVVGSFDSRLRKLRTRLLVSSALAVIVGVGLLVVVVTIVERQNQRDRIVAELDRRTTAARSLIYYSETAGTIQIDGLVDDEAINERPHVFAIEQANGIDTVVFSPQRPDFELDLKEIARRTTVVNDRIEFEASDNNGQSVLVVSRPFYHDETDEIAGAVVATTSPTGVLPGGSRLLWATWLGSALLSALLCVGSRFLIDRSLAPAAVALVEHERFVADAAHEIRHPLAALRANAEHGLGLGEPEPALQRSIEILDYTTKMLEDLLALARLDGSGGQLSMELLRLDQLVETVADDFSDTKIVHEEPSTVTADARLVRQAVVNLLANAAKHGAPPIRIEIRGTSVKVSDNGPGFGDNAKELTNRFNSGSASTGTGLGLALAVAVARAHGGDLTVGNSASGGGVVELRLGSGLNS